MTRPVRLGMLTPSSNTALEPITNAMLAGIVDVTAHFSRFKVTEIALSEQALRQFDHDEILRAATLLADAKVDVIAWNGTSASWLGFEHDERLCERITASTGIRACTTVLAFRDVFRRLGLGRVGLVTPYRRDVQDRIIANWGSEGFHCVAERHLSLQDNFSFAEVPEAKVAELIEEVVREGCDAVAVVCTNMRGAGAAAPLERRFGVPVIDSIAVTLWACLLGAGVDPARIKGWGGLFDNPRLARPEHPAAGGREQARR
ncbi:aspartate/glutamate racemase family protein [Bradyrhizobium sp. NP1]|uniref:maleate cis-trans isomerase family protein n=1 Tax=Bradyrhizobium sp. NP1 TaxID=3049772 RepID=UPI0025A66172|nr:aspartate/glutamate racemase family protein [Bradyrhizobium sp. NP1]WJR79956.1 aspartate/glutamate racemase family protein [Bradyrhizobium sp. NP1]